MNKCGIYGIFNTVNGKVLVGSSIHLVKRFYEHKAVARMGIHKNPHFQQAWKKYGEDAFEFRILEECQPEMLLVREDAWINYHQSLERGSGYNLRGAFRAFFSEETRERMSAAHKGYKNSEESRRKMSASRTGEKHWNYGKHHSGETKQKIREANKGWKPTEAMRQKMSAAQKSSIFCIENRRKMSEENKGKRHSEKTKQKMSESAKSEKRCLNFGAYLTGEKHSGSAILKGVA